MEANQESQPTESTQSMSKLMSNFKIPDCQHGKPMDECKECRDEREERKQREAAKKESERKTLLAAKQDHPERWMKGIPQRYLTYTLENYQGGDVLKKVCRDFAEKYPDVDSLLFTGSAGCGKTHLAIAICRELIRRDKVNGFGEPVVDSDPIWDEPVDMAFTTVPEFLLEIRRTFKDGSVESEDDIVDKYAKVPLLLLDDLGAEKASEFAIQSLYLLIDRRNRELKPTIITTNLSLNDIEERLNGRIASRLAEMKILKINMPDYRKKRKK